MCPWKTNLIELLLGASVPSACTQEAMLIETVKLVDILGRDDTRDGSNISEAMCPNPYSSQKRTTLPHTNLLY